MFTLGYDFYMKKILLLFCAIMLVATVAIFKIITLQEDKVNEIQPLYNFPQNFSLQDIFKQIQADGNQGSCLGYYGECMEHLGIPESTVVEAAFQHGVIQTKDTYVGDVTLELVGTSTIWWWEIGACSTNKRVRVNAITGETQPIETYVYCGGLI